MFSFVFGAVVGGAALGAAWMLVTTPAVFAFHSNDSSEHTLGRKTRDAWIVAYAIGILTYALLRISGLVAY